LKIGQFETFTEPLPDIQWPTLYEEDWAIWHDMMDRYTLCEDDSRTRIFPSKWKLWEVFQEIRYTPNNLTKETK